MPKNPHANFTPTLEGYSGQGKFRFWCQMALPLTYDDSLSYYELLCKVVNYLNHTIEDVANAETNVSRLAEAYTQLQHYVNNYFDDLDIEAELRNVLDAMAEDGTLDDLLDPLVQDHLPSVVDDQIDDVVADQIDDAVAGQIDGVVAEQLPPLVEEGIPDEVSDWLTENVDPVGSAVVVDSSLTISGAAADAKVTGDELTDLKTQLQDSTGLEFSAKSDFASAESKRFAAQYFDLPTMQAGKKYVFVVEGAVSDSDTWGVNIRSAKNLNSDSAVKTIQSGTTASGQNIYEIILTSEEAARAIYLCLYVNAINAAEIKAYMLDGIETFMLNYSTASVVKGVEIQPKTPGLGVTFSSGTATITTNSQFYMRNTSGAGSAYDSRNCEASYTVANNQALVCDLTTKSLSVVSVGGSVLDNNIVVLIANQSGYLKGLWAPYCYYNILDSKFDTKTDTYYNELKDRLVQTPEILPITPGIGVTFSGNNATLNLHSYYYIRNVGDTGNAYVTKSCDATYTVENGQGLVFDSEDKSISVISVAGSVLNKKYILLVANQSGFLKGLWAQYCYKDILEQQISNKSDELKTLRARNCKRVISRQGEGYGFPDNSAEGIIAAVKDGYSRIRLSVATTSDDVYYCTHSYEMQHNSEQHVLTINGEAYNENVSINSETSTFIDTLEYKGYAIPRLADVLAELAQYGTDVTLEIKDDSFTSARASNLFKTCNHSNVAVTYIGTLAQIQTLLSVTSGSKLNIGIVDVYTDAKAQTALTALNDNFKKLDFCCSLTWENVITDTSLEEVIHPNYNIRVGGTYLTWAQVLEYMEWADGVEYTAKLSTNF